MKRILALIIGLMLGFSSLAQVNTYSYLYIEGDKETPFYVKLEGTMQPRLGKHYAILSNLDKGYTKIEVLFEQNKYPAQSFFVNIPENASRALQLRKLDDGKFALYDLIGAHYIISDNKKSDQIEHLLAKLSNTAPTAINNAETTAPTTPKPAPQVEALPAINTKVSKDKKPVTPKPIKDNTQLYNDGEEPILPGEKPAKKEKNFIDNVAINGSSESQAVPPNTDCRNAISNEEFGNYLIRIKDKADDDAKLKYIQKQRKSCYTTAQIAQMALSIKSQSGRMQLTKMMYAQVSDPQEFKTLESIFTTEFLKKKFKESL